MIWCHTKSVKEKKEKDSSNFCPIEILVQESGIVIMLTKSQNMPF